MRIPHDTISILHRYLELDRELLVANYEDSSRLRMEQHLIWLMIPQSVKESGIIDRLLESL